MVYQLRIKLCGLSKPAVWRKLEVPADFTFDQLHLAIQTAFGWCNAHLYKFEEKTKRLRDTPHFRILGPYVESFGWDDAEERNADEVQLFEIFPNYNEVKYEYDFGDDWEHIVKLEKVLMETRDYPVCTGGRGTTPPEDCGGVYGYYQMVSIFEGEDEKRKNEYCDWLGMEDGMTWDTDFFPKEELKDINQELKKLFSATEP